MFHVIGTSIIREGGRLPLVAVMILKVLKKAEVKSLYLNRVRLYIIYILCKFFINRGERESARNWKINLLIHTNDVCRQNAYPLQFN